MTEGLAEIVGSSGEIAYRGSISHLPCAAFDIVLWGQLSLTFDEEQAQVAVIAVKQLLSSTLDRLSLVAFQLHIHIRLSCTDPYLTDHHVAQLNVVLVLEADEVRASCLRGLYL